MDIPKTGESWEAELERSEESEAFNASDCWTIESNSLLRMAAVRILVPSYLIDISNDSHLAASRDPSSRNLANGLTLKFFVLLASRFSLDLSDAILCDLPTPQTHTPEQRFLRPRIEHSKYLSLAASKSKFPSYHIWESFLQIDCLSILYLRSDACGFEARVGLKFPSDSRDMNLSD